jgi:hypothetical protein
MTGFLIKFKVKVIEGTSDIIDGKANSFNETAARYASRYNQKLFEIIGCNPSKPMDKCRNFP